MNTQNSSTHAAIKSARKARQIKPGDVVTRRGCAAPEMTVASIAHGMALLVWLWNGRVRETAIPISNLRFQHA